MYAELVPLLEEAHHPPDEPIEGASAEEIRDLEARLGIVIPESLAAWLRVCRGSAGGDGGLFGVGNSRSHLDIDYTMNLFPGWQQRGWIPVAGDGCGNYYVLMTAEPGAPVGFVDTISAEDEIHYVAATSLPIFLRELLVDVVSPTGWPFDRNYVAQVDPAMLEVVPSPFQDD